MKKLGILSLSLMVALTVGACDGKDKKDDGATKAPAAAEATAKNTDDKAKAPAGDAAKKPADAKAKAPAATAKPAADAAAKPAAAKPAADAAAKPAAAKPAAGGSPLGDLAVVVDKMCACPDMACLQGLQKDLQGLQAKYPDYKPSPEDMEKATALQKRMMTCSQELAKKITADAGAAAKPAAAPAAKPAADAAAKPAAAPAAKPAADAAAKPAAAPAAKPAGGSPIAALDALADKVCACKDMACMQGLQKEMMGLQAKFPDFKPGPEDMVKMKPIQEKLMKCTQELAKKGAAAIPAPAPAPTK